MRYIERKRRIPYNKERVRRSDQSSVAKNGKRYQRSTLATEVTFQARGGQVLPHVVEYGYWRGREMHDIHVLCFEGASSRGLIELIAKVNVVCAT